MTAAIKPKHIPIREDWLRQHDEAVIDPGQPIIDAHHHLWDKQGNRYLLAEMRADIDCGHRVLATVFAEGKEGYRADGPPELRPLGETEMIAAIAEESARDSDGPRVAAGIIGYVDLMIGAAAGPVLDRHVEAGCGRFRGVPTRTCTRHTRPQPRSGWWVCSKSHWPLGACHRH